MNPNQVKYELVESDAGVSLTIWEPAPDNTVGVPPYRFMINYAVKDAFEAEKILRQFFRSNELVP